MKTNPLDWTVTINSRKNADSTVHSQGKEIELELISYTIKYKNEGEETCNEIPFEAGTTQEYLVAWCAEDPFGIEK